MIFKRKILNNRILKRQKISEATLIIAIITLTSKIVGYIREALIAKYFGATAVTDAFDIAIIVPSLVFGLIAAGGLQNLIIPVYTEKKKQDPDKAKILVNQLSFAVSVLLVVIMILIVAFPGFFVKIFAYGFKEDRFKLAQQFIRILVFLGFFNVFAGLFTGILHSEKQFLVPSVVYVAGNMLIPVSIVLLAKYIGIYSWAIGEIAFALFVFTILFSFLRLRWGFFRKFDLGRIDWTEISTFAKVVLPITFISGLGFINQIVDKTIASSLVVGSVAILHWAQLVYFLPVGLISTSLNTAVYPTLSHYAVDSNSAGYLDTFEKALFILLFVMLPIMVLYIVLSKPIVTILFQRGAFTSQTSAITANVVSFYSLGMVAYSINDLLTKVFYSFKDTKTPLVRSIVTVGLNITGNIILSRYMGPSGIALSTAIASAVGMIMYSLTLKRRHYVTGLSLRALLIEITKLALSCIPVALLSYFLLPKILTGSFFSSVLRFVGVAILAASSYIAVAGILKSRGFRIVKDYAAFFTSRLSKKR